MFQHLDAAEHKSQIVAAILIDATYEGDLAALANAKFRLGRESHDEFGEPHAGQVYMKVGSSVLHEGSTGRGDSAIQAYCFRFTATTDPTNRVQINKPEGYNRDDYNFLLSDLSSGQLKRLTDVVQAAPLPNGKFVLNNQHPSPITGLPSESLDLAEENWLWPNLSNADRSRIYKRYLTHNVGLIWMLQHDPAVPEQLRTDALRFGWCKDEFVHNSHLPRQVYVREGRRIVGEYLITEHDGDVAPGWERTRPQPESIALAEWGFDCHGCHRYDPAYPGTREGYTLVHHATFQIPYGAVIPVAVDGLLVPVAACSATHLAYNAVRMEPVFMALGGEACGQAAHLAIKSKTEVRTVNVERLQQILLKNRSSIAYLSDLDGASDAFVLVSGLGLEDLIWDM